MLYWLWIIYYKCSRKHPWLFHHSPTFNHVNMNNMMDFTMFYLILEYLYGCFFPLFTLTNPTEMPSIFTTSSGAKRNRSLASSFNTCIGGQPQIRQGQNHQPRTLTSLKSCPKMGLIAVSFAQFQGAPTASKSFLGDHCMGHPKYKAKKCPKK